MGNELILFMALDTFLIFLCWVISATCAYCQRLENAHQNENDFFGFRFTEENEEFMLGTMRVRQEALISERSRMAREKLKTLRMTVGEGDLVSEEETGRGNSPDDHDLKIAIHRDCERVESTVEMVSLAPAKNDPEPQHDIENPRRSNEDDASAPQADADDAETNTEDSYSEYGLLVLPETDDSGNKLTNGGPRRVSDNCAICINPYEVGDVVVWSSNPKCEHAFHEECIIPWLGKKNDPVCPNCRQTFIELEENLLLCSAPVPIPNVSGLYLFASFPLVY